MGKFQLRKPKIISKNFPGVGSHIDNVSKSLNDLVFSYSAQVDRALQKKHLMMALSSLVLILVVGNFISPKGRADIATFYPDTCLGGWLNPHNAEKEPQTNSNADLSQFDDKNSAILDKNVQADIYCGNFNGTFNDATQPTKIIVSFALTNKEEITTTLSTSAVGVEDMTQSTSTDITSSTTDQLLLSTSTETIPAGEVASTSSTTSAEVTVPAAVENSSFVDIVVDAVTNTVSNLFNGSTPSSVETDTVVVPQTSIVPQESPVPQTETQPNEVPSAPVAPEPTPTETPSPTSYVDELIQVLASSFFNKVLAEEVEPATSEVAIVEQSVPQSITASTSVTRTENISSQSDSLLEQQTETPSVLSSGSTSEDGVGDTLASATTTEDVATTTVGQAEILGTLASSTASSTEEGVSVATSTTQDEATDSQNNFLEILYTFDGITWVSLGELNEISMKYRTFEIPLSASSTWSDMSQLQIKVMAKSQERGTPVVYLDGIKVEVLYDSPLEYSHPDFVRDTILNDVTVDGMRLVTIINNETNEEETWYMYLDEGTEVATSTSDIIATTTIAVTSTSTTTTLGNEASTSTATDIAIDQQSETVTEVATSSILTDVATSSSEGVLATTTATSTPVIVPVTPKNKWFKLEKKEQWVALSPRELVEEIKRTDKEKLEEKDKEKEDRLPDFALDIIKRIKGALLNAVIVQVEKEGKEELWLYDLESGTQYKIEAGSSTSITIAKDMQLGLKESNVFWLSEDRTKVYAYHLIDKSIQVAEVPPHDLSLGERGRVSFTGVPWEVIVGSDSFAFYSEATGEVFSDDNSSFAEALRQKLDLDKVLNQEELGDLNLQVTEDATDTKEVSQ